MKYVYLVNFVGYSDVISYESSIEVTCVHSLNQLEEAQNVLYLIHKEIKKHFSRFEILSIEVL